MSERSVARWLFAAALLASAVAASAGEGVVALQTADPSCPSDSVHRYRPCSNGTVTDNQTGLVWLANASCFGQLGWHEALDAVAGLGDLECSAAEGEECDCGLSDGSSPGEWRLPSRDEWEAMVADGIAMDCEPAITTDVGDSCWYDGCEDVCFLGCVCTFYGVQSNWYWSSSPHAPNPANVWTVQLEAGHVGTAAKTGPNYVWPVRGGQ